MDLIPPPLFYDPFVIFDDQPLLPNSTLAKLDQKEEKWYATIQGGVMQIKVESWRNLQIEPPERKPIGPMSKNSRKRLLRMMNIVNWDLYPRPTFVTLTYPDTIVHRNYWQRSKDRYLFLRHLEKYLDMKVPAIWRVEWMPRKTGRYVGKLMPHWHILLPNVETLKEARVRHFWRKTLGHDASYIDIDVRQVTGIEGAIKYLSKYVSKKAALGINAYRNSGFAFGRHWGVTRKNLIEFLPVILSRECTPSEIEKLASFAESTWEYYDRRNGCGFMLLGKMHAKFWASYLFSA